MDPLFTRIIKLDILTSLALEPSSIEAVLRELRTYIRHSDRVFVCATLRAVGKVAELARIVYDRHGIKSGDVAKERKTANRIALDCLYGLTIVTQSCDRNGVVGECVCVMQSIMLLLTADAGEAGGLMNVEDPNDVQGFALRRIILLLVQSLVARIHRKKERDGEDGSDDDDDDDRDIGKTSLGKISVELPPRAVASSLWIVGEWMSTLNASPVTPHSINVDEKSRMRLEIARLLDQVFPDLHPIEKEQGIHFSSKLRLTSALGAVPASATESAVCEHILAMGRVDVNPDVRDRARFESSILQATVGMKHDSDTLEAVLPLGREMTAEDAKNVFLRSAPAPSFLPVEDENAVDTNSFRFGTLSSLVGHKARAAYLPLPPWGEKNSPSSLRDPADSTRNQSNPAVKPDQQISGTNFYAGEESNTSDEADSSDSSSSSDSDGASASGSESDDSSDDSSSDDSMTTGKGAMLSAVNGGNLLSMNPANPNAFPPPVPTIHSHQSWRPSSDDEKSDGSEEDNSSSSSSSDNGSSSSDDSSSDKPSMPSSGEGNLLAMGSSAIQSAPFEPIPNVTNGSSSALDDLRGLVMAPMVVDEAEASSPDVENDSSAWMLLVRPEHCGGLSAKARYLRGPTKEREAQLNGFDPRSASLVCLQFHFSNE